MLEHLLTATKGFVAITLREITGKFVAQLLGDFRDKQVRKHILAALKLSPAVNPRTDRVLFEAATMSRKNPVKSRILMPTGYYFTKRSAFLEAILAIHLRMQGAEVVGLTPGDFFEEECPLFEPYRRDERLKINLGTERALWRRILRMPLLEVREFSVEEDRLVALDQVANLATFDELVDFEFRKYPLGYEAYLVALNLISVAELEDTQENRERIRIHLLNSIRYVLALQRLISAGGFSTLVSQFPFYYNWSVPHMVAKEAGMRTYGFSAGDSDGSLIVSQAPEYLHGLDKDFRSVESHAAPFTTGSGPQADQFFSTLMGSDLRLGNTTDSSNLWRENLKLDSPTASRGLEELTRTKKKKVFVPLNIHCDMVTLQGSPMFKNYREFLGTIVALQRTFSDTIVFIVKVHPAETLYQHGNGWKGCGEHLLELGWPHDSDSVLIPYQSKTRASELWPRCDAVLSWSSTVTMEAAAGGLPNIQVGYSHLYQTDYVLKPGSIDEIFSLLDELGKGTNLMSHLPPDSATRAAKYGIAHYTTGQVNLGLFRGSEIYPDPMVEGLVSKDIIKSQPLTDIAKKIIEGKKIFPTLSAKFELEEA